jgi:dTDP-4-dehydrorhamnose reductase
MKRILLIGCHGQVGVEIHKILEKQSNLIAIARPLIDLTQPETLRSVVREVQPEVIINAAAYTAVDKAESEAELAQVINATAPLVLAEEAHNCGASLIHISTDYVFDGNYYLPYEENHATNPLSIYGQTKLMGEEAIRACCSNHIILRTAWIYGAHGKSNFVKTMLRLGPQREEIRVVSDQIGSPTWARDIANTISQLALSTSDDFGTYHFTNSGVASWYDFATAIFEEAEKLNFSLQIKSVIPITTAEYPTSARRPHFSVLDCRKISVFLGTYPTHWRQSLVKMLTELKTQN